MTPRPLPTRSGAAALVGRLSLVVTLVSALLLGLVATPAGADAEPPSLDYIGRSWGPVSVAPPGDSRLMTPTPIKRDCGFSVELTGGRALWIFCDSTNVNAQRKWTYLFGSTAAYAYAAAPTVMREPVDPLGRPYPFITPLAGTSPCVGPYAGQMHVIWPSSATRVPALNGRDRVLVWFTNYCYKPGSQSLSGYTPVSMGLADIVHDPADPAPHTKPIQARIVNPHLWFVPATGGGWFGEAATYVDGLVFVYRCARDWGCQIARVAPSEAATPASYRYWNGSTWQDTVPDVPTLPMAGTPPEEAFNVVYLPAWKVWAMASMHSPGAYTDKLVVRVARSPRGPFGDPVVIPHAVDCQNSGGCYAGHIHSQLSGVDELGLSTYAWHHYHERGGQVRAFGARAYPKPPQEGVCYSNFPDVGADHTFCTEIRWFGVRGITTGYPDGTFRPGAPVTRQAMAAWFYRAAGSPAGPFPPHGFSDVGADHTFATAIAWFAQQGITTGYDDGTFRPGAPVTRQAMAAFFYRANGSPPGPFPNPRFKDVPTNHQFYKPIAWLAHAGITTGYPDGTYRPGGTITRQAIAAFFYRSRDDD